MLTHSRWCLLLLLGACAHRSGHEVATVFADEAREISRLEHSDSPEQQLQMVVALQRARLFTLAFIYGSGVAKSSGPQRLAALETLVRLQEQRQDDFLIPSMLERLSREQGLSGLSAFAVERVTWFNARIAYHRGLLSQVVALCEQIPPTSIDFARAQYLMGLALADERLEGGAGRERALGVFGRLAEGVDQNQTGAEVVHAQSLLALGRLAYARREWAAATAWYERAAKLPSVRTTALFEQSLALLRAGDFVRSVALLRSDEVRESGIAEVALTEAMALHFSRDATSAEAALTRAAGTAPNVDWSNAAPGRALEVCKTGQGGSPLELKLARENPRLTRLLASLEAAESERRVVSQVESWQHDSTASAFDGYLGQNLETLRQVADRRCLNEFRNQQAAVDTSRGLAELVGIEVALARRDLDTAIARTESVLSRLPSKSVSTSEMLFRLMALKQARSEVLKGAEAQEAHAQVVALLERIVDGDPAFERLDEARRLLNEP